MENKELYEVEKEEGKAFYKTTVTLYMPADYLMTKKDAMEAFGQAYDKAQLLMGLGVESARVSSEGGTLHVRLDDGLPF